MYKGQIVSEYEVAPKWLLLTSEKTNTKKKSRKSKKSRNGKLTKYWEDTKTFAQSRWNGGESKTSAYEAPETKKQGPWKTNRRLPTSWLLCKRRNQGNKVAGSKGQRWSCLRVSTFPARRQIIFSRRGISCVRESFWHFDNSCGLFSDVQIFSAADETSCSKFLMNKKLAECLFNVFLINVLSKICLLTVL